MNERVKRAVQRVKVNGNAWLLAFVAVVSRTFASMPMWRRKNAVEIDPTYVVGTLLGTIFVLTELLKHKEHKKNGTGYFSNRDRAKLDSLYDQHSQMDVDGRPIWYGNKKTIEELSAKSSELKATLSVVIPEFQAGQQCQIKELKRLNETISERVCPYYLSKSEDRIGG